MGSGGSVLFTDIRDFEAHLPGNARFALANRRPILKYRVQFWRYSRQISCSGSQALRQTKADVADQTRSPPAATDQNHALDGTLWPLFERWYPGIASDNDGGAAEAAA
jgi:hypothetical protein